MMSVGSSSVGVLTFWKSQMIMMSAMSVHITNRSANNKANSAASLPSVVPLGQQYLAHAGLVVAQTREVVSQELETASEQSDSA